MRPTTQPDQDRPPPKFHELRDNLGREPPGLAIVKGSPHKARASLGDDPAGGYAHQTPSGPARQGSLSDSEPPRLRPALITASGSPAPVHVGACLVRVH